MNHSNTCRCTYTSCGFLLDTRCRDSSGSLLLLPGRAAGQLGAFMCSIIVHAAVVDCTSTNDPTHPRRVVGVQLGAFMGARRWDKMFRGQAGVTR